MTSTLPEPYALETLPLDTPDDDPRWAQFIDAIRLPLLSARANEAGLEIFRRHRRADGARLRMVTASGPGLTGRVPVATFNTTDRRINTGAAEVGLLTIATITVLASHRRRGLLTAMMRDALASARDRGLALAGLSATEAVIYGRFGFSPVDAWRHVDIDAHRFAFRPGVPVAEGIIEIVEPASLEPHIGRLFDAHVSRHPGSVAPGTVDALVLSGQWDRGAQGPSTTLRAVAHFDATGQIDGFATFTPQQSEEPPTRAEVGVVLAADPAVERALWRWLASLDLIDVLGHDQANGDESLAWSLVDRRAVTVTRLADHLWLRILDLPAAVAGRAFCGSGSVTLTLSDPLGFCAGSWLVEVIDGRGQASRTDASAPQAPEVAISVETLAGLWLGGTTPATVIDAGLVTGDAEALGVFASLFASTGQPRNLSWF